MVTAWARGPVDDQAKHTASTQLSRKLVFITMMFLSLAIDSESSCQTFSATETHSTLPVNFADEPVMNAGAVGIIARDDSVIVDPVERSLNRTRIIEGTEAGWSLEDQSVGNAYAISILTHNDPSAVI